LNSLNHRMPRIILAWKLLLVWQFASLYYRIDLSCD
jgi:hypothetical protein